MSISGWLLGHQSGVLNGQWVCDTCLENMQKAADRFGGGCFLLGCERIFSEAGRQLQGGCRLAVEDI